VIAVSSPVDVNKTANRRRLREVKSPPADENMIGRYPEPTPVDSSRVYGHGIYKASQVSVLLARYVRIRGDLLVTWHDVREHGTGQQKSAAAACADVLNQARDEFEKRRINMTAVAHRLSLADRALLSALNLDVMRYRLHTILDLLRQMKPVPELQVRNVRWALQVMDNSTRPAVEAAAKDALTFIGEQDERYLIEDDLQVSRLNKAIVYVVVGWIMLMGIAPFVSQVQQDGNGQVIWPVYSFEWTDWFDLLIGALGLSIVGAVGGIISGMFSVRDATTTLREYRASVKRLTLKPFFGAVAALVVYFFLSAEVINGVSVTSAGPYVVAAFLAGFSERYFLRVIEAGVDKGRETPPPPSQRAVETSAFRAAEAGEASVSG
jgi:hypothetical protein